VVVTSKLKLGGGGGGVLVRGEKAGLSGKSLYTSKAEEGERSKSLVGEETAERLTRVWGSLGKSQQRGSLPLGGKELVN